MRMRRKNRKRACADSPSVLTSAFPRYRTSSTAAIGKSDQPCSLSLFEGALDLNAADLHNASSAAVLIVTVSEKTFVLTFGYGRSLLRPGVWEEDFGLRVTLNAVDPLRIRSVDRFKFDAISQHSQIQASRDANIVEFGLDVEQDLLRAVTGKPRDPTLANQLTGK